MILRNSKVLSNILGMGRMGSGHNKKITKSEGGNLFIHSKIT